MSRQFVLQILIIFLFLSSNSIAFNQNIFDDAKIYFEKKDYNQSKFLFQKFLVLNPKNEEALFMLIELQLERSNFSKVKELNKKFLLICSKLCNNKSIIDEKIKNLEPKKSTKQ